MKKTIVFLSILFVVPLLSGAATIEDLHEKLLYPVVRVVSGGSGTVLYSKMQKSGTCRTFVLTNHHVVSSEITIKEVWDPLVQKEVKREYKGVIRTEMFRYIRQSTPSGQTSWDTDILAYNKDEDLALLEVRSEECYPYVAVLLPREDSKDLRLFMKTWAVGASLGHVPIPTEGHITGLNEIIDNMRFEMSTAQTIYGNSGGAVYLYKTLQFIGVPSRVMTIGWGNPITHMGFYIPIERIYAWLERENLRFIYSDEFTVDDELNKRKENAKRKK